MTKIFITGGSGLLGSAVAVAFRDNGHEVVYNYNNNALDIKGCRGVRLDIKHGHQLDFLMELSPEIIIHCASLIGVDYCEQNKEEAYRVNVEATENIARLANEIGAKLVYISSDYVFDGERGMYREEEEPKPINYYGQTKLLGEKKCLEICKDALIIRTSIHGWNPIKKSVQFGVKQSFSEMIINKLRNNEDVKLYADQFNSPVLTNDLADAIVKLVKQNAKGIIHATCSNRASKFDFGLTVAEVFGITAGSVVPATSKNLRFDIPRPRDVSLNTELIEKNYGIKMPTIEESLKRMKKLEDENYLNNNFQMVEDVGDTGC